MRSPCASVTAMCSFMTWMTRLPAPSPISTVPMSKASSVYLRVLRTTLPEPMISPCVALQMASITALPPLDCAARMASPSASARLMPPSAAWRRTYEARIGLRQLAMKPPAMSAALRNTGDTLPVAPCTVSSI